MNTTGPTGGDLSADITGLVTSYLDAETWEEKRAIAAANLDALSSAEADTIFEKMSDYCHAQGDDEFVAVISQHRTVLAVCHVYGVDGAFKRWLQTQPDAPSNRQQVVHIVLRYALAPTWIEARQMVEAWPLLLTPAADATLERLIAYYQSENPALAAALLDDLKLLEVCRNVGVEAAFATRVALAETIVELMKTESWSECVVVLHRYPGLIDGAARAALTVFLLKAQGRGDQGFAEVCQERLDLIDRCFWLNFNDQPVLIDIDRLELHPDLRSRLQDAVAKRSNSVELFQAYPAILSAIRQEASIQAPEAVREAPVEGDARAELVPKLLRIVSDGLERLEQPAYQIDLPSFVNACRALLMLWEPEEKPEIQKQAKIRMALAHTLVSYPQGQPTANLREALELSAAAVGYYERSGTAEQWARAQSNMGTVYQELSHYEEHSENLERAIQCLEQALTVAARDTDPRLWADIHVNLGNVYVDRTLGDPRDNWIKAKFYFEQALAVFDEEHYPEDWANLLHNLGILATGFLDRFAYDAGISDKALSYLQQALRVRTRRKHPEQWARTQKELSEAYRRRRHGDRPQDLRQAIKHARLALEIRTQAAYPVEWALTQNVIGGTYLTLAREHGGASRHWNAASAAFRQALQVFTPEAHPSDHRMAQSNLGHLHFDLGHWQDAYDAYSAALIASDLLYQSSDSTMTRQVELAANQDCAARAAYCLAQLGRAADAVVVLERNRARSVAEVLARNDAVLQGLSEADRAAFVALRGRIAALESEARASDSPGSRGLLAVSGDLHQTHEALADLIQRIREQSPEFMPEGLDFAAISAVADRLGAPLIYWLVLSRGGLALVVLPTVARMDQAATVEAMWLKDLDEAVLWRILFGDGDRPNYAQAAVLWDRERLQEALDVLWPVVARQLVEPVADRLTTLAFTKAVVIPIGALSLLPLHALAPDSLTLTYAPSARALESGLRKGPAGETAPVLLGVGNPSSTGQRPLAFARPEVESIAALFTRQRCATATFYEDSATQADITAYARGATYLHFSCHGRFSADNPLDSALYLAGEDRLTLRDLLDGGLDVSAARLAVLSACQTGITDFRKVPNEAMGFPAGFLQAGVPAVVSTLWPVADLSTALLISEFYRRHLVEGQGIAEALRGAQFWLRDLGRDAVLDLIEPLRENSVLSETLDPLYWELAQGEDKPPFAHPYYWGAFTASGAVF